MAGPFQESPIAAGFGDLIGALTGRGRIREEAQRKAQLDLGKIAEGEIKADEFRQRQAFADNLIANGVDPQQAGIIASTYRAGAGNFQQGTAGLQNLADLAIQADALERAKQPTTDLDVFNRILATRSGQGPIQPNEARVADLGEQLVQRARNQAALDAARITTEGARRESYEAQAEARRHPFKVGKPGQQVYAPQATNEASAAVDAALADIAQQEGRPLTQAEQTTFRQTGSVTVGGLPPQARAKLREGVTTTFGNGQQWTLQNGQPVRVK